MLAFVILDILAPVLNFVYELDFFTCGLLFNSKLLEEVVLIALLFPLLILLLSIP